MLQLPTLKLRKVSKLHIASGYFSCCCLKSLNVIDFLWSLGPRHFWLLDMWTPTLACLVCGVTRQACPPQRIETTHRCAPSKSSGCSISHSKHYYFMFFPFLLAPYCSVEAFSKSERKILTKADTKICLSLSFG